jgi:hypothetical protein
MAEVRSPKRFKGYGQREKTNVAIGERKARDRLADT